MDLAIIGATDMELVIVASENILGPPNKHASLLAIFLQLLTAPFITKSMFTQAKMPYVTDWSFQS